MQPRTSLTLRPYELADHEAVLRVNERAPRAPSIEFGPGLGEDHRRQGYGRRVVRALHEALGDEQVGSRTHPEHGVRLVACERRL